MLPHECTPILRQSDRYKTFWEENKRSFDDGMARNIDRDSGFDEGRYKRNQKILKVVVAVVVIVTVIIVLVCIL